MIHKVKILSFNDNVEEEVCVEINGINLFCFSNFHTHTMKMNDVYSAELELIIFEGLQMKEMAKPVKEVIRIGETFSYILKGYFNDGILDVGINIDFDSEDIDGFWYLDRKYVEISGIDRINIDFLIEE